MHPRVFLDSFWRNDLKPEVFVAMSFDKKYDDRWESIFIPAIEGEKLFGMSLNAVRVDIRKSGDSILSEITDGIAHSQIVLADISVTDETNKDDKTYFFRNGNVMYEVGVAIACRQPVEVILVRDDNNPLLFDLSHIPVISFSPENRTESINTIRSVLSDRLKERNLIKDLRFVSTLESLSQFEINLIRGNAHLEYLGWEGPSYPPAVGLALPKVLERKILKLTQPAKQGKPDIYTWTTFGRAIADYLKAYEKSAT